MRDIVLDTLRTHAPGRYRISGEHAGFHLILWLAPDHDENRLLEAAKRVGLQLQPLRQSCHHIQLASAFVLGFAALTRAQAKTAARTLAQLLQPPG